MKKSKIILGCDISKDKIDISAIVKQDNKIISEKTEPNNLTGFRNIIRPYVSVGDQLNIVLEATGNYHIKFTDFLESQGIKFSIINPLIIKRYAQMKRLKLKTDRADASIIAQYGVEQDPKPHIPLTKPQKELKSLRTVRDHLIKQRTMTKNLLHSHKLLPDATRESLSAIKITLKWN